jgi:hypothetical protein
MTRPRSGSIAKGRAMPTSMRWWLVAVALGLSVGTGPPALPAAAPATYYVHLRFDQDPKASVYLSFQNNRMWVGRTSEEMEASPPLKAKKTQVEGEGVREYYQSYSFPETELPVTLADFTKVRCEFSLHRIRSRSGLFGRGTAHEYNYGYGSVTLVHQDAAGGEWRYVVNQSLFHLEGKDQSGLSKEHPATSQIPRVDLSKLSYRIETKMEGRKARIGLQITAGKAEITAVQKDKKGASIKLEVLDKAGKVVHSQEGDAEKFGFT